MKGWESQSSIAAPLSLRSLPQYWNQFFFTPRDPSLCSIIRIGYGLLLFVNMAILLPDFELWFSESGVMPYAASRKIIDPDTITILGLLPQTPAVLWTCFFIFLLQIALLSAGFLSRFQAVCVFIWLFSFQHRHLILFDGEDTVFRLFGFFLIFMPLDYRYSVDAWIRKRRVSKKGESAAKEPPIPWALRLMQIQMSIIYLSTVIEKLDGQDWLNGTALYYVARLDDMFGHLPLPAFPFESLPMIKFMSWSVLAFEIAVPFALWFRETRRYALLAAFVFHLATDYAMHLFLFHWIMMVGLLSFTESEDWRLAKQWLYRLSKRLTTGSQKQARLSH